MNEKEIERKFLLANDSWRPLVDSYTEIKQGYIYSENCTVRIRIADKLATITLKGKTVGITRSEFEYPIPKKEARKLLNEFCHNSLIEKRRYIVEFAHHTWEIDEFFGNNSPLIIAEIELKSEEEVFSKPPWLGREVSEMPEYYNSNLVLTPMSNWDKKPTSKI